MRTVIFPAWMLIFFCSLYLPTDTFANNLEDEARAYFENKQYQEALGIWKEILQSGKITSGVYYNLGLTESRLGNTPNAMLAFEKALRLKPSSKMIRKAILHEREKIENAIIPVKPFFLAEWFSMLRGVFRPGYWAFLGLLVLSIAVIQFIRKNSLSSTAFLPGKVPWILAGVGLILLLFSFLSYVSLYRRDEAILHSACIIKQAPSEESPPLLEIYPGEKIIILDQLSGWFNVRLVNLEEGWIRMDCLTILEMGKP